MSKVMIEGPEIGAAGRFNIVVKNADGSVKKDYGWQSNLFTQYGLNGINNVQTAYELAPYQIFIGTGSGTPAISDTSLFEPLTGYTRAVSQQSYSAADFTMTLPADLKIKMDHLYPDGYAYGSRWYQLTASNMQNKNITELCLGNPNNNGTSNIATHAIIRDENGQPTAITVLTGEILQIRYEVYAFIPYVTKRGTIKLKKTPDMAIPEQYTEDEYDYQLQIFRAVNKELKGQQFVSSSGYSEGPAHIGSNYQIKIPDDATQGPVDFDKWRVPYDTRNATNGLFTSSIANLFNPTSADNATFFINMEPEYRLKNLSSVTKLSFPYSNKYSADFLNSPTYDKSLWYQTNKYAVDGFKRTSTIIWTPFNRDGQYKGNANVYVYNSGNSGDNGLRGLFFSNSGLTGLSNSESNFDNYMFSATKASGNGSSPNMLVVFSKKSTGEGIKKEWGWFLEITFGFNTVGIDLDSVKIVNASMDTSTKVLNQTHTLDLTYEEGATYNVEIQSLVENVSAEELVSVDGLTLTQVAQSGSFNVKVTVSKEGMIPRTFTQSFTIASSN